jgi:hypothetical protein
MIIVNCSFVTTKSKLRDGTGQIVLGGTTRGVGEVKNIHMSWEG